MGNIKQSKWFSSITSGVTKKSLPSLMRDIKKKRSEASESELSRIKKTIYKLNLDPRRVSLGRATEGLIALGETGNLHYADKKSPLATFHNIRNQAKAEEKKQAASDTPSRTDPHELKLEERKRKIAGKKRTLENARGEKKLAEHEKHGISASRGLTELQAAHVSGTEALQRKEDERKTREADETERPAVIDMMID